jgi:golgin subfamily B member 1
LGFLSRRGDTLRTMRIALQLAGSPYGSTLDGMLAPGTSLKAFPLEEPLTLALWRALSSRNEQPAFGYVLVPHEVDRDDWLRLNDILRSALDARPDDLIEEQVARGASLSDEGRWEESLRAYEQADRFMAAEYSPRRASVLVCMAQCHRAVGRVFEAVASAEHALAIFPSHRGALRERLELAAMLEDAVTSAALLQRTVAFAESYEEGVTTLSRVADHALTGACQALEHALKVRPGDAGLLERLRAIREAMGQYQQAVDAGVALAETLRTPAERARALVAAADMCARKVGNVQRAVALYEAAISDDPTVSGAFEAIEAVLIADGDHRGAERAYTRQLERLQGKKAHAAELLLLDKLARIRLEKLSDKRGAIEALDKLVVLSPDDIDARLRLSALLEAEGQDELALRCLEIAAQLAPGRPDCFSAVHRIASRTGDHDRAYAACAVLVHLGEAELDEQMVYQQYAPENALPGYRPLDESGWELLTPAWHDDGLASLLGTLEAAAVGLKIEQLQAARKLAALDPKQRQDPEKSTLTAVRAVQWAAGLIGVAPPAVYARNDDVPGGLSFVAAAEPSLLLGKSLLTGRTIPELAFLIAREIATVRGAGRLLAFFPSLGDLRGLLESAMGAVLGDGPRSRDPFHALLGRLDPNDREAFAGLVRTMTAKEAKLDVAHWVRGVETMACRAGLLACDDVTVAARMLAVDGRAIPGLSPADKIRDLASFSVSQKFHAARSMTGLSARTKG